MPTGGPRGSRELELVGGGWGVDCSPGTLVGGCVVVVFVSFDGWWRCVPVVRRREVRCDVMFDRGGSVARVVTPESACQIRSVRRFRWHRSGVGKGANCRGLAENRKTVASPASAPTQREDASPGRILILRKSVVSADLFGDCDSSRFIRCAG